MTDRYIAEILADRAMLDAGPELIRDDLLPEITNQEQAENAIARVVAQDPSVQSKRLWSAAFAVATALLAVPEVQAMLGPWAPVASAIVSAGLAVWSKADDPRPIR